MNIVLIGIQGSGKSTQGKLLSKELRIPYLSSGHIFRDIAKHPTPLGRYIKEVISSGMLVPDDLTVDVIDDYLSKVGYQKGYILDGFPRTLRQAQRFKKRVDKAIYLDISEKEAIKRLQYRAESRSDDTAIALRTRIGLFRTYTMPVATYYNKIGNLIKVNASQSIDEVTKEILQKSTN